MSDDEHCPECGSVVTEKGMNITGESADVSVSWWSCLSCDWNSK